MSNEIKLMEANLNAVYVALAARPPKSQVERCNIQYDDKAHNEEWRNQCARDLNAIVEYVAKALESGTEADNRFAEAALRIVERVAEFEQITEVDEKLDAEDKDRESSYEPHHAGDDEKLTNE
jgi:plasmid stabilization system protein ParE